MRALIHALSTPLSPEELAKSLGTTPHVVLLRSTTPDSGHARYSFVAAAPFLTFTSFGPRCELVSAAESWIQFGNPWHLLDGLMSRYELLEEMDLPFPLGGCFGFWGYELKNFVEPKLARHATNELGWPDCHVGFYDSLVAFDHWLGKAWIISTGLRVDGSRDEEFAVARLAFWKQKLNAGSSSPGESSDSQSESCCVTDPEQIHAVPTRSRFISAIERAQRYIRAGDIYQVNLSHRLTAPWPLSGWELFKQLNAVSPAPFSAYLDCGGFQIISSSPELFLRLSGAHVLTRPIKGTRPRSADPNRDAQLTYELQTSAKEMAELVMITDLLRNDLGRVCEYGSVQVPELVRLERFAQVQHLVSTVEGRLRPELTHFAAFASCFPGGSITGAPKIRAMEIIDELEPVTRGPYTGALGYLGFNRESQLSILIRAGFYRQGTVHFHAGAGIVADSNPEAEYEETIAKARGFFSALGCVGSGMDPIRTGRSTSTDLPGAPVGSTTHGANRKP